jgi:hypothetical protein
MKHSSLALRLDGLLRSARNDECLGHQLGKGASCAVPTMTIELPLAWWARFRLRSLSYRRRGA